jgi:hypothetical protein
MTLLARSSLVNPDGGYTAGYCAPAMGLVRVARAAGRLRDAPTAHAGLATGASVVAAQVQAAVVLEGA